MSTLQFKKSPRLAAPRPPGGEVHLEPPPEVPRVIPGNIVMKALPVVMIVASLGMMVFMFPLMMYAAPSGLALYFIVNSTGGILESRYIRSHIDKYDLAKPGKKPPGGGGGFMARLQKIAEERQKAAMQARGMQPPRKRV